MKINIIKWDRINRTIRINVRFAKAVSKVPFFKKHTCIICNKKSLYYLPFGVESELYRCDRVSVGGRRKMSVCPFCMSNDRDRWIHYVITNYTDIYTEKGNILHIAPEKAISDKIRENKKCKYITGDIISGYGDVEVNVMNMQFENNFFNYIIMNHVLEHVEDERKAISELKRCLKKEGKLLISFPVWLEGKTIEDKQIVSPKERLKIYGQEDHCRLYGIDAKERLEQYGFNVLEYRVGSILQEEEIKEKLLIKEDRIYLCKKV